MIFGFASTNKLPIFSNLLLFDRERMERLLGPVLTAVHRRRMYCKIYGDLVEEQQAQEEFVEEQKFPEHLEEVEL